jgi:uncharacterized protein (DUF58 family)
MIRHGVIRPTRRAVHLAVAAPLLALGAIGISGNLWPLPVGYLAAVLLAILMDGLRAMPASRLTVSLRPLNAAAIGASEPAVIDLITSWRSPPASIEAKFEHDPLLAMPDLVKAEFAPHQAIQFDYPMTPNRRGLAELAALWLRWRGPLGLTEHQRRVVLARKIRVVPNIAGVRAMAVRLNTRDALFGAKAVLQLGDGSEFDALRDYAPGLDRRTVDWKHSARHRRLVSKEFRAERNHQIILAFDTGYLMREPLAGIPKLDHAINAGLVLGYASLKSGDRVGLFGFDSKPRRYAPPLAGPRQFARLQREAAELDYSAEEVNFTLGLADLTSRLSRRSLIVLTTEFIDTVTAELMLENVARMANRHLVLFVTLQDPDLPAIIDAPPQSFAGLARSVVADELRRDRLVVFERLRRLGVQCLEAPHNAIGVELINRYLAIKQRESI